MKTLNVVIEMGEDAFYAYVQEIAGCTAGGNSYEEVRDNMRDMIDIFLQEEPGLAECYKNGYKLRFQVDLESVFKLIPEINVTTLARHAKLNPGLLRQYASGTKKASEAQAQKVSLAITHLADKLRSFELVTSR